jgi:hypothetical protein
MPLESEAVPDASAPPDPFSWPPPEGVAAQSPDAPALDVDIPIDEDTEQKTTSTKIGAVEFGKLLRLGSRLSRTEWFSRYEPMSDPETKLAAWLAAVDTLPALMNLARGSLSEDTVTVLCYQFYEKNLIDVVGSDGQG